MAYDLDAIRKAKQTYKTNTPTGTVGVQAPIQAISAATNMTPRKAATPAAANAAQMMVNNTMPRTEQTLNNLQSTINTGFNYDRNKDDALQAAIRNAQQTVSDTQRNTNAQLRAGGQGKSSYSESVAQQIGMKGAAEIENNLVPQHVQQAYQRYQDGINNQSNLYGLQYQQDVTTPMNEAQLTGNYVPPAAQNAINGILALKQQAESQGITAGQRAELSKQADGLRAQLQSMGIDPTKYGSNVNAATAGATQQQGLRTLAGQSQDLSAQGQAFNQATQTRQMDTADSQYSNNFEYQKARDAISDKQWQDSFDRNATQYGMDYALRALSQQNDASYREAQLALSQDDNARQWAALENKTTSATTKAETPKTYENFQSNIEKIKDVDKSTGKLRNPQVVQDYIKNSPLSSYEKYRAWVGSGLEWPSNVEVPKSGE